jgi:hypothetical protein
MFSFLIFNFWNFPLFIRGLLRYVSLGVLTILFNCLLSFVVVEKYNEILVSINKVNYKSDINTLYVCTNHTMDILFPLINNNEITIY